MAFRSKEMMKKLIKKIGGEKKLAPGVKESLEKSIPNSRVVMGRAHRGLFAGRHIQYGNNVSEKGGNTLVPSLPSHAETILFVFNSPSSRIRYLLQMICFHIGK